MTPTQQLAAHLVERFGWRQEHADSVALAVYEWERAGKLIQPTPEERTAVAVESISAAVNQIAGWLAAQRKR